MATHVYWHDQGSGLWEDPTNWTDDQDGLNPLVAFDGTEHFRWDGTGTGAADPCTLSGSALLVCRGFTLEDTGTTADVSIGANAQIDVNGDDTESVNGAVVSYDSKMVSIGNGARLTLAPGASNDVTVNGSSSSEGFACVGVVGNGNRFSLRSMIIKGGGPFEPIGFFGTDATVEIDSTALYAAAGAFSGSYGSSGDAIELAGGVDFVGDTLASFLHVAPTAPNGASLSLYLTGSSAFSPPAWAPRDCGTP